MTAITLSAPAPTRRFGLRRLLLAPLPAAAVAAVANLAVFVVAKGLFDVSFVMPYRGPNAASGRLPAAMVVIASVVPAIAAAVLLWALGRFARRPLTVFWVIASLALLASVGGPLSLRQTETSTRVALIVMHVVAAAVTVGLLTASARRMGMVR